MTTMLLSALGALLCSLVVTAEVMPQGDFNLQGVAGKWYVIGFATNAQWFVKHRADMKMGTTMLTPTANGDLDIAYSSRNADGSCWRMNHLAKKTKLAGKFIYKSERWSNENDMRVVEVKYDEYALIHTKTKGVSAVLTNLYVYLVCHVLYRGTDLSPGLLQKFRQFSLDTGYPPPKNDECPAVKFHPCFSLSKRAPLISLHGIATRPVDPWQPFTTFSSVGPSGSAFTRQFRCKFIPASMLVEMNLCTCASIKHYPTLVGNWSCIEYRLQKLTMTLLASSEYL